MFLSMYEKFDLYLKEEEYWYEEYWYEEGSDVARKMLSKFTEEDWNRLTKDIFTKSLDYQEKVAYCMYNENNKNELEFLLYMTKNTKNIMIFEVCMDSLVDFVTPETKSRFLNDHRLMELLINESEKEKRELNKKNKIFKSTYEQFLEKLDYNK